MLYLFQVKVKPADVIVKWLGTVLEYVFFNLAKDALRLAFFFLVTFFKYFFEEVMHIHALVNI